MDIRNWCKCNSATSSEIIHLGRNRSSVASSTTLTSKKLRWRDVWLWIKFKRRKILESKPSLNQPYDSYSYMLNFDHGFVWEEPDNVSRSFSVRFADSSRLLGKKKRMVK